MPVTNTKQAQIVLSKSQMKIIGELAERPGARNGCRVEETNLGNGTVAVIPIPSKRIHLVAWDGKMADFGQEK